MKPRRSRQLSPGTVLLVRQILVGVLIATFFGLLISSIWFGTRVDALTIQTIEISGGETIAHSEVERVVNEQLVGSYLGLVPRKFVFTYPHTDIERSLHDIARMKNLQIIRYGGSTLKISFDEYVPDSLWCAADTAAGCFFLDETGYSFAPAPVLHGGAFVRFSTIGRSPAVHSEAFASSEYHTLRELITLLAEAKWFVAWAEVDAAGDAFLRLVDGGEFKISLKQSPKETVDNLLTVLRSEKFSHIKPGNFEYVDLRFGSKVFVNEVTLTSPGSSTPAVSSETEVLPSPAAAQSTDTLSESEESAEEIEAVNEE